MMIAGQVFKLFAATAGAPASATPAAESVEIAVSPESAEAVASGVESVFTGIGPQLDLGLSRGGMITLYCGMAIYILIILLIGYFAGRKIKGMGDFLVAGRRLPLWMATATLLATWFGAGSSMGVCAQVYSKGIGAVRADPFGAAISLILAGIFIVGVLRRLKCLTVTDIVERRYGRWAGIYTSIWMVPVYVGWLGAQVLGIGTILKLLLGVSGFWGSIIGAAIVLIYTMAGGMWAVTLTDVVQVSLIVFGLFLIVPEAVHMAGGWGTVFDVPAADLTLKWVSTPENPESLTYYIGSWMVMGLGCMVGQDLIQRSLASRNEKIAISSSVIAGFCYLAIAIVPITIGFAARVVLAGKGVDTAAMGGDSALENQVLPRMAIYALGNLSPLLLTIFLSALVSAIMSSADSSLLAASSLITNNVIASIWPRIPDKKLLLITRIATLLVLVVATYLAMSVQSIYALMKNCWASQLVIVFMPVIAAIYMEKSSKYSCWACMVVSTIVWLSYCFVGAVGIEGDFTTVMGSSEFDTVLTEGAVYGFIGGVIALFSAYWGERMTCRLMDGPVEEED